eukprot:TRINITY_DN31402_c0_g1_i1.p1 TRINITY_DN31402_c0_g1~~TRINITY_DN31402_c0_g1_i1.p1  ORF type:complete len:221 (+),score=40.63 TRINITY_DN31402_c0_g1_i1:94-756(+)
MVEKAKERAARLELQLSFAVRSAEDLSQFADASFDVVTANFVIMFAPNKQQVLDEAMRVLKPSGCFVATVWKAFYLKELVEDALHAALGEAHPAPTSTHALTFKAPGSLEGIIEKAGFHLASAEHCTLKMQWDNDEETARENFCFIGRSDLQDIPEVDRSECEARFLRCVADEVVKRRLTKANGTYEFTGRYQIVVITRSPVVPLKRCRFGSASMVGHEQ